MARLGEEWSPPNAEGIRTCVLEARAKSTLQGRRLRRAERTESASGTAPGTWPGAWIVLLRDWLANELTRTRVSTLLGVAGHARSELATQLLDELLRHGWIEMEERRSGGAWRPMWIRFLDVESLRRIAGLPDRELSRCRLEELMTRPLARPSLMALRENLERVPVSLATRRMELLLALDDWMSQRRFGTRRDFSLYARGDTKAIPDSDWAWLESALGLEDYGIRRHIPLLLVRAPWRLEGCCSMDLRGVPDCIGLSQQTIATLQLVEGDIETWCLVENRTLFERVAAEYGGRHAVLWLPGNPPDWWREAVSSLLRLAPASALIACDPDPAGIKIAMAASTLWSEIQQSWRPWGMSVEALESLDTLRPLTTEDMATLKRVREEHLPLELARTADWMGAKGLKGEQEGLSLAVLERDRQNRWTQG